MFTKSQSSPSLVETDVFSEFEQQRLEKNEIKIQDALRSFVEMGEALEDIRDNRLYRKHYKTFDEYCLKRWNFGRKRAYQHIGASRIAEMLSTNVDIEPTNEGQVRPLVGHSDNEAIKAWKLAEKLAGKKNISASIVKKAVATLRGGESELAKEKPHASRAETASPKSADAPAIPTLVQINGPELSPDNEMEKSKREVILPSQADLSKEKLPGIRFELADGNLSAEYRFDEDDLLSAEYVESKIRSVGENNSKAPEHLREKPSVLALRQSAFLELASAVNKIAGISTSPTETDQIYWAIEDLRHLTAFLRPAPKQVKDEEGASNA